MIFFPSIFILSIFTMSIVELTIKNTTTIQDSDPSFFLLLCIFSLDLFRPLLDGIPKYPLQFLIPLNTNLEFVQKGTQFDLFLSWDGGHLRKIQNLFLLKFSFWLSGLHCYQIIMNLGKNYQIKINERI